MTIAKLGILGAGTMGAGIAVGAAQHGVPVTLVDISETARRRALEAAGKFFARAQEKGRLSDEAGRAALARITTAEDAAALLDCGLVIEAVFEDFDLKARVFETLSGLLPAETVLATNTSCLTVGGLAAHVDHPERFLGMHYFSPAEVNPLVEIVRGERTGDGAMAAALSFARDTGKRPLVCRDSPGFAVNRFFCPYTNEAARVWDEGLGDPARIDRVAQEALGAAAGPFFVQNIIKPRINLHAIRNLAPLGPFYAPAEGLIRVGDADESFPLGETPAPDPALDGPIAERLLGATFLAVLQELDEEVASPADIDMGASIALRFGKPPCALMDALGAKEVSRLLQPILERFELKAPGALGRVGGLS